MSESQKLDEWIIRTEEQIPQLRSRSERDVILKLKWLLTYAYKQTQIARMIECGEVPEHIKTERTITSHAT